MEYTQLENRIAFLDNQYHRDRQDIAQLRHRLDVRETEREQMTKRIAALEAELTILRSESQRIDSLEHRVEQHKNDLTISFDTFQKRQKRAVKEVEQSHVVEVESQGKAINEIRRSIERSRDLDELVTLARTETDRQSSVLVAIQQRMDTLAKQNDDQLRAIGYMEEQRRTDVKRIAELQNELTDVFKRINYQISKIELLEDQIPQFGQFQLALEQNREVIQGEVERSLHQLAHMERQVKSWEDLSKGVNRRLDEFEGRMNRYAEHYQVNQKSLESLEVFQERLVREQREFVELQRLAFDRQQSKLEDFETTQSEEVRSQGIEVEMKLNEMMKEVKRFEASFVDMTPQIQHMQRQFNLLLKIIEEDALARSMATKEWQDRFEQLATEE